MNICDYYKCTACYACINACAHHCISMEEDKTGSLHPIIDEEKCIHCNLCIKSCPNNVELEFKYPISCHAAWITDKEKRKICASGGIGTALSEYIINQKGIVFGSRYDKNMLPIMTYTDSIAEIEKFKGSRYVQSIVGEETFKKVRFFLQKNIKVLFIGTPCQIAGLKSFLHKNYENLITVDLICHGVCPTKYFTDEISFLKKKYKLKNIADIRFRGNDNNNFNLSIWNEKHKRIFPRNNFIQKICRTDQGQQYYIKSFLLGISLRENCYSCNYAHPQRISDITIGDFIGLGKKIPFNYKAANISSVIINTEKGNELYSQLVKNTHNLTSIERPYTERLQYSPSLLEPYHRHNLNPIFTKEVIKSGYVKAIRLVLRNYMKEYTKKCRRQMLDKLFAKLSLPLKRF